MTEAETSLEARATFADRVDILYAIGRHYLSLPFAALCLPTAFFASHGPTWFTVMPLLMLLAVLLEGGIYEMLTAILILFFAAVLFSYCSGMSRLLNESIRLRRDNEGLVARLSREKQEAEKARDTAEASMRAKSVFISNI